MARKVSSVSCSLLQRCLAASAAPRPRNFSTSGLSVSGDVVRSSNRNVLFSSAHTAATEGFLQGSVGVPTAKTALLDSSFRGMSSSNLLASSVFVSEHSPVSLGVSFSSSPVRRPPPPPSPPPSPPPPPHRQNPPDGRNPDTVTLQDQWRYAIRLYSQWYAHAWGTSILAGILCFALGWLVKGGNPLSIGGTTDKKERTK